MGQWWGRARGSLAEGISCLACVLHLYHTQVLRDSALGTKPIRWTGGMHLEPRFETSIVFYTHHTHNKSYRQESLAVP